MNKQRLGLIMIVGGVSLLAIFMLFKSPSISEGKLAFYTLLVLCGCVTAWVVYKKVSLNNVIKNVDSLFVTKNSVATSDHRYDGSVERSRGLRWIVFLLSISLSIALPMIILIIIAGFFPFSEWTTFPLAMTGVIFGINYFSKILPLFIVDVPQVQGFVTINKLISTFGLKGDTDVIYGPGWHVSYPWEGRSEKSNFSLEVFTLDWKEEVPGLNAQLLVSGSYQFEVDLPRSDKFIGIDEETIRKGALDIIKAEVSQKLSGESGDDAKSGIKIFNKELMGTFGLTKEEDTKDGDKDRKVESFEERYGIKSVAITISGINLPEKVQETRDAVDEAQQVLDGVAAMYGLDVDDLKARLRDGRISQNEYNEMLDRFAAKSGNATMNIQSHKIHGLADLAPLLNKISGG